jgi:hypothetical protein
VRIVETLHEGTEDLMEEMLGSHGGIVMADEGPRWRWNDFDQGDPVGKSLIDDRCVDGMSQLDPALTPALPIGCKTARIGVGHELQDQNFGSIGCEIRGNPIGPIAQGGSGEGLGVNVNTVGRQGLGERRSVLVGDGVAVEQDGSVWSRSGSRRDVHRWHKKCEQGEKKSRCDE